MKDRSPEVLGVAVAVLAAASMLLCLSGIGASDVAGSAEDFQRLTGGLGEGSALAPLPCESGLDPATSEHCTMLTSPAAGGIAWCPVHAGPSLRR